MLKDKIIYTKFLHWQFDLAKAEGVYLWDKSGQKFLDFTSGWNTANLGWNHPEIIQAMIDQTKKNTFCAMWMADPIQREYADLLVQSLPKGLKAIGRTTGGMEANLEAIKLARCYTGRKKILGFTEEYHGQGIECMKVTYKPEWMAKISNQFDDFLQIPFPDSYRTDKNSQEILGELESQLEEWLSKKEVAAVITESGVNTGYGATSIAPEGFLSLIRKLTSKYGTLLILDEVGSGFSRLGRLFALEIENVVPDFITLAKGISNGSAPIGAVVTTQEIAQAYAEANLQSTFGWLPVSCAAAKKTLEIHLRDQVWEKAEKDGQYLRGVLKKELGQNPRVGDIRGRGMIIGVDLVKNKKTKEKDPEAVEKAVQLAREKGLHLVCDHESNLQIMPPLIIKRKDLDQGLEILLEIMKALN